MSPIWPALCKALCSRILWKARQTHHNELAISEGSQYVGVGHGEGQGGDRGLEGDAGQGGEGEEVPQHQVTILISTQHTVTGAQQSCILLYFVFLYKEDIKIVPVSSIYLPKDKYQELRYYTKKIQKLSMLHHFCNILQES